MAITPQDLVAEYNLIFAQCIYEIHQLEEEYKNSDQQDDLRMGTMLKIHQAVKQTTGKLREVV